LQIFVRDSAQFEKTFVCCFSIIDTPVSNVSLALCPAFIRMKSKLESGDVETNIEWFVEVRLNFQYGAVPVFRLVDVVNVIDRCA